MFVGVLKENKWNKFGKAVFPKALKDLTFLFNRYPSCKTNEFMPKA